MHVAMLNNQKKNTLVTRVMQWLTIHTRHWASGSSVMRLALEPPKGREEVRWDRKTLSTLTRPWQTQVPGDELTRRQRQNQVPGYAGNALSGSSPASSLWGILAVHCLGCDQHRFKNNLAILVAATCRLFCYHWQKSWAQHRVPGESGC